MVKFFKNQDIQVNNFAVAKSKVGNTFFPDLLLANDDSFAFPLILSIEECNFNFNSSDVSGSFTTIVNGCTSTHVNNNGYLASSPNDTENNPQFQIGKKYTSSVPFYTSDDIYYDPTINPKNSDGTYQGQVYNTVKNMYYNDYNNCYNIFGFDSFNNSPAKLNLQNSFVSYMFNVTQSGDRIRPFSLTINNQTGDIVADIKDDGNYNLYLSGSFFTENFEFFTNNQDTVVNYCERGLAKYICTGEFNQC